jgi:hypothetical protein
VISLTFRDGVKNLHESKSIPESLYMAFGYYGNKDAYPAELYVDIIGRGI